MIRAGPSVHQGTITANGVFVSGGTCDTHPSTRAT